MNWVKLLVLTLQVALYILRYVERRQMRNELEVTVARELLSYVKELVEKADEASNNVTRVQPGNVHDPADRSTWTELDWNKYGDEGGGEDGGVRTNV